VLPKVEAVAVLDPEPVAIITTTEVAADIFGAGALPIAVLEPEATPAAIDQEGVPDAIVTVEASESSPQGSSAEDLQRVALEALGAVKGQGSASDALADAEWTVAGGEIRVQTELSKTMLPMVINPEADRIVRNALRNTGVGQLKLVLLPGSANATAAKKPKAARTGSAQAKAMDHPVVQQAQRLFNAEIRNVIDLRDND
jgi:DNA polymerase-3 subunit gamma/tau